MKIIIILIRFTSILSLGIIIGILSFFYIYKNNIISKFINNTSINDKINIFNIQHALNSNNIQTKNIDIKRYCIHKINYDDSDNIICYTKDKDLPYTISINKKQLQEICYIYKL